MHHHRLFHVAVAALVCACAPTAFAQETRQELVQKIQVAQGIQDQFEKQLADQREALKGYGAKLLGDIAAQTGGEASARDKAAFDRFLQRCAQMFSGKELAAKWAASYGADLSTDDLREVLAHYESPIGKKEVRANKAAMAAFSAWMNAESQVRTEALIAGLLKDLQPSAKR
ncbi:MAG: DUF2059 domain-containing protein [Pseudomonadota bacterium]